MPQLTGSIVKYPARASAIWYLTLIAIGTMVLMHPACRVPGRPNISVLDAVFTSTSATCVTGLAVRSTENDFSFIGQLVILTLIQLGGIGIMTVTTFVMFHLGARQGLRQRAVITETLGADSKTDLRSILWHVILMTLAFEAAGFLLLLARNLIDQPLPLAAWHALFHSVSAFCNAGFSLFDDSLTRFQGDPLVNATIIFLIVIGGLGFPVILDIRKNWRGHWRDSWDRLHLHSKLMLIGTAALLSLGAVVFLVLEWDGVLAQTPLWQRPIIALFHSATCRTAGFNTVDIAALTNAMLFISILLMMIGGGPCSTAGGFKVSTAVVLVVHAWWTFRGYTRINLFRRTIPEITIVRATVTAMLFAVIAVIALTTLLMLEQSSDPHPSSQDTFLDAVFEVFSALGTVGLSTGLTPHLTTAGKLIVVLLMFLGRLGPITVFVALSRSERKKTIEHPTEELLIG